MARMLTIILWGVVGLLNLAACSAQGASAASILLSQGRASIPQSKDYPDTAMHVAWNPNGLEFATVNAHLHVLIFNAKTQQLVRDLGSVPNGRSSASPSVAYSPDGRYLAAGKDVISIFEVDGGLKVRDIVGPYQNDINGKVSSIIFSPDSQYLGVIYQDYSLRSAKTGTDMVSAYEVDTGKQLFFVAPPEAYNRGRLTTNAVYTPDGQFLLIGRVNLVAPDHRMDTGKPSLYSTYIDYVDTQTGKFTKSITPVHVMQPMALAISADGRYVATGTNTMTKESKRRGTTDQLDNIDNQDPVRLWDVGNGKLVREFGPIHDTVQALAISPDGRYLAVDHSLQVIVFDLASGRLLQTIDLPGQRGISLSLQLAFSPDSKVLAVPLDTYVYLLSLK